MTEVELDEIARRVLGRIGGTLRRVSRLESGNWNVEYDHPKASPLWLQTEVYDRPGGSPADLALVEQDLGRGIGYGIASMD